MAKSQFIESEGKKCMYENCMTYNIIFEKFGLKVKGLKNNFTYENSQKHSKLLLT